MVIIDNTEAAMLICLVGRLGVGFKNVIAIMIIFFSPNLHVYFNTMASKEI